MAATEMDMLVFIYTSILEDDSISMEEMNISKVNNIIDFLNVENNSDV